MPLYAALIYSEEGGDVTPEQMAAVMAEYNAFGEAAGAAGVVEGGEALEDTSTATTVHVVGGKGGEVVHTDGPYAETKEALGGFYLLRCDDLDQALEWAARIPGAWWGHVEVRPCIDFSQGS